MYEQIRREFFPVELIPGIVARPGDDETVFFQTISPLFEQVFTPLEDLGAYVVPRERQAGSDALRDVFRRGHRERFVFCGAQDGAVGWSFGDMLDAETFFMTNAGILPAHRRRGIYTAFLKRLLGYLAALGYERVTSKHQTNNSPVIVAKLKAGFVILGVDLDERWGAQVELAYFFHDDRRRGYERAFSLERVDPPVSHR